MKPAQPSPAIETVLGPIAPEAAGLTLMHEHLLCDVTPPDLAASGTPRVEVTLENVHEIRQGWILHYGNHILDDRALMARELADFAVLGGGTLVELTVRGLAPDPAGLAEIARASGVHVVAGTGYYIASFCPEEPGASVEKRAAAMIADLTTGMGQTSIRAGIIGEIGVSDPCHPAEQRVLTAAALAQQETGAAISVHPGRDPASPGQIMTHLVAAGASPERVIIGHLDRTFRTPDEALRLAETGCVLEWDFFGIEASHYPFADFDMPNDARRLDMLLALRARGHLGQVTISHDICTITRLRRRGGHGYGHIIRSVLPMMRRKGFSDGEIEQIMRQTPARLLAW